MSFVKTALGLIFWVKILPIYTVWIIYSKSKSCSCDFLLSLTQILEFDTPSSLLADENSCFRAMMAAAEETFSHA